MDERERKVAAQTVYGWIAEVHGRDMAEFWAWELTPYPVGLPSDDQLEEGLRWAVGPHPFDEAGHG